MRKTTSFIAILAGIAAAPAVAHAAVYEGEVKDGPGTVAVEVSDGKAQGIVWEGVKVKCDDGQDTMSQERDLNAKIKNGKWHRIVDDFGFERYEGELFPKGKMKGLLNARIEVGGAQGTCKTDRVKWVAEK
jgi:hypothetical protein